MSKLTPQPVSTINGIHNKINEPLPNKSNKCFYGRNEDKIILLQENVILTA